MNKMLPIVLALAASLPANNNPGIAFPAHLELLGQASLPPLPTGDECPGCVGTENGRSENGVLIVSASIAKGGCHCQQVSPGSSEQECVLNPSVGAE